MADEQRKTSEAGRVLFDRPTLIAGTIAGLGAAIAIGVMEWFSLASHFPLAVIPFATSIVLVISHNLPWSFLIVPVFAGALLLTAFALAWHRFARRQDWPQRWC